MRYPFLLFNFTKNEAFTHSLYRKMFYDCTVHFLNRFKYSCACCKDITSFFYSLTKISLSESSKSYPVSIIPIALPLVSPLASPFVSLSFAISSNSVHIVFPYKNINPLFFIHFSEILSLSIQKRSSSVTTPSNINILLYASSI